MRVEREGGMERRLGQCKYMGISPLLRQHSAKLQ